MVFDKTLDNEKKGIKLEITQDDDNDKIDYSDDDEDEDYDDDDKDS